MSRYRRLLCQRWAMSEQRRQHVVVLGGGFGGLAAVRALRRAPVDVTLVDRQACNTFQPLLYQVATAGLDPGDITYFFRSVHARQSNMRFVKGVVDDVDTTAHTVRLEGDERSYNAIVGDVRNPVGGVTGDRQAHGRLRAGRGH